MTNHAILLAGGHGIRARVPEKQYALVGEKPLLWYALNALANHPRIQRVVVVIPAGDEARVAAWLEEWKLEKAEWTIGGDSRQASARAGFEKLNPKASDLVVFHNAANPFVTHEEITAVLDAADNAGAAFVGHLASDTLKQVKEGRVVKTLDRSEVWHAQTPQALRADIYRSALAAGRTGTDEMSLVEAMGVQPVVVAASTNNIKITTSRDLEFARFIIEGGGALHAIGLDSHRFDPARKGLVLGGVFWPNEPAMIANSDGDVMLHALCNALLQSVGGSSLGTVADDMLKEGVKDSTGYLAEVLKKTDEKKLRLAHVGFQLEAAHPKIDPMHDRLKRSLSGLLDLAPEHIGITATSGEGLTPFGRGEGLQCFATVTLKQR